MLLQPALVGGHLPSVSAASAVKAKSSTIANQIVKLNASSYIQVRDAQLLMQSQGLVVAYTVTVVNNSSTELDLLDYFIRLKGKNGKIFKSSISSADSNTTTVAPKSSVNLKYYAVIDSGTKATDLSFQIVKWDFSLPNYERNLGTIKFPTNSSEKVAAFQPYTMIIGNSKIKGALKQYIVTQDDTNGYVTISFLLENVGSSSIDLSTLNFALQTDSYSVYDVSSSSLTGMTLQPYQRKIVTVHSVIPTAVLGKPAALVVFSKDDTNKVSLANGSFAVPALKPVNSAGVGEQRMVYIDGTTVSTSAGTAFINVNGDQSDVTMNFDLTNTSTSSIAMPDLDFSIRTKDGAEYPLTYTKEDGATLLPKIDTTISLTGQINAAIDATSAQLIVRKSKTDTDSSYVLGTYKLSGTTKPGAIGSSYTYDDDYSVTLKSIQRSPLSDSDMLVAELDVTNKSNSSVATPNLSGYFMINGVKVNGDTNASALDDQLNIDPKGTYGFVVYTKIPYTTSVDNVKFVLTAPVDDKTSKTLYQFSSQNLSTVPVYQTDQQYDIQSIGHRTSVKLVNSAIYTGDKDNRYFFSEFEATNEEARSSELTDLGAYVKDKNGVIVPIAVSTVSDKVSSGGKVLITAWGQLTKSFDTDNYQLYVGRAIDSGSTPPAQDSSSSGSGSGGSGGNSGGSGSGTGSSGATVDKIIVDPIAYAASANVVNPADSFTNLKIGQDTVSLRNFYLSLNATGETIVSGAKLSFDYDLTRDDSYDYVAGTHQLEFEIIDQDSQTEYTSNVSLVNADDSNANQPVLIEGSQQDGAVNFDDSNLDQKIHTYQTYKLNIYDVYGDAKLLVASRDLKWFTLTP